MAYKWLSRLQKQEFIVERFFAFGLLAAGVSLVAGMVWLEKRPRKDLKVSLVPTTPVMFLGALIAIVAVAWLLSVFGITLPERGSRF